MSSERKEEETFCEENTPDVTELRKNLSLRQKKPSTEKTACM
ncbi:hypothetical protein HMPREF9439_00599 [Parasutterella excrementihominis YIT 11859]|uniref:Uncharacterized protein n=1 Tax=Parasutterella excrementihominis YIT 11859 TaxID=762966 RepID=F3QI52_9BURK|nr:hypothetical protein HMPREF9439_00599 [Parasutterella excrementihominis YIT 11859]